jgi:hypothetical protein
MPVILGRDHPKRVLENKNLSLEAKGLYCIICNCEPETFSECFSRKAFDDLVEHGYCKESDLTTTKKINK